MMTKYSQWCQRTCYRLALVSEVHPDEGGLVRMVTVDIRDRRKRGDKPVPRRLILAVQRLAVILPVEERWESGLQAA